MKDRKWDPEDFARQAAAKKLVMGAETALVPTNFNELVQLSRDLADSGLISRFGNKPACAMAAMQAGLELGIPPMRALQTAYVIHGNIGWEIKALQGLVMASDRVAVLRCYENTESAATWCGAHVNDPQFVRAFRWTSAGQPMAKELASELVELGVPAHRLSETNASKRFCWEKPKNAPKGTKAVRVSYMEKDMYRSQPAVMLNWRALGDCLRMVWPEVLSGVTSSIELQDMGEPEPNGDAVDAEVLGEPKRMPRIGLDPSTKVRWTEWRFVAQFNYWLGQFRFGKNAGSAKVKDSSLQEYEGLEECEDTDRILTPAVKWAWWPMEQEERSEDDLGGD